MRRIVDAHHHLWDLDACSYPWLMARGVPRFFGDPTPIQKNYLVEDFRRDAQHYELEASVHIQVGVAAGDELKETAWLQATGDARGLPSAIVAFVALEDTNAPAVIDAHRRHSRLRGVRQIIGRSAEEDASTGSGGLIREAAWRDHFSLLGELGLSFDLQLIPSQMPDVLEVLSQAPETAVALCHCGSPWDQSGKGLKEWRRGLELFAELPQVSIKISGLGMFDHDWDTDSIRPIVETCIDVFGAERAMFGSNFPVDKLHGSYERVWGAFEAITANLGVRDRDQLFAETARRFYRIE